jgi:CSLREA domain-containing protein
MMTRTTMHPLKILAAVGAALLVWGLVLAYASSPAWAADITVNSLADDADGLDGECTLREAITSANSNTASGTATGECATGSEADVIKFALPGTAPWTVNLGSALPDLSTNIDLEGPGPIS